MPDKEIKNVEHRNGFNKQNISQYIEWRDKYLRSVGEEIARNFPNFYGKIYFNIQNGRYINSNYEESIK